MALKTVKIEPGSPLPEAPQTNVADAPAAAPTKVAGGGGIRKKVLIGLAALAGIAVLWLGSDWLLNGRYNISTDNAQLRSDIARVTPKIEGYVAKILVAENQPVKEGDLLVELADDEFVLRLAHAKANLAQAESDAAQARARISVQRDTLAESRAAREAADANADLSASDAKRLADLAAKGWYPKAKLDQVNAAKRTANAQLTQADASITAQRSQLTSVEAAALSAEAKVEAAKAEVAGAELELGRTKIRAPINGTITKKDVIVGQILSPGRVALSIVSSDDVWVLANFKETQINEMRVGQCVSVHVDAYPDRHFKGHVQSLSPSTGATFSLVPQDSATGNFTKIVQRVPVKIVLDQEAKASGLLRAGLQVTATVSTKTDCE